MPLPPNVREQRQMNLIMKKRLVWNFEINISHPLDLPRVYEKPDDDIHWESRFFWSEREMITLSGLDEHCLDLSRYTIKHRSDTYFLLPDADYNIKARKQAFIYKPLIEKTKRAVAYGKKIKLEQHAEPIITAQGQMTPQSLIQLATTQGRSVLIEKEALIYKFDSHPNAKLELARLSLGHAIYFSVGIESRSRTLVEDLSYRLIGDVETTDYITFLKREKH